MVQCGSERWRNLHHKPAPDAGSPPRLDKLRPLIGEIVGIFKGRVPRGSTLTTPGAAESVNAARLPRAYFRDRRLPGLMFREVKPACGSVVTAEMTARIYSPYIRLL
jgi:hypothetical protein